VDWSVPENRSVAEAGERIGPVSLSNTSAASPATVEPVSDKNGPAPKIKEAD
jgi:hypothetical protein